MALTICRLQVLEKKSVKNVQIKRIKRSYDGFYKTVMNFYNKGTVADSRGDVYPDNKERIPFTLRFKKPKK